MSRFVILRHETSPGFDRPTHWDLMLERDGVLRTWALAEEPSPGRQIAAEPLADHRLAYLDYEGEVSGNRGWVSRWDAGTYEVLEVTPSDGEETPRQVRMSLHGQRLRGEVTLAPDPATDQWRFVWKGN